METYNQTWNAKIALFLGHKETVLEQRYFQIEGKSYRIDELKYDTSWDWLMKAVDKIETMGYSVDMAQHQAQIFDTTKKWPESLIIDADFQMGRKNNTFDAVVGFVKYLEEKQ